MQTVHPIEFIETGTIKGHSKSSDLKHNRPTLPNKAHKVTNQNKRLQSKAIAKQAVRTAPKAQHAHRRTKQNNKRNEYKVE
jgi:hypothetical protein